MIRTAGAEDLPVLKDMFMKHISSYPEYISHGELQMGVARAENSGGELKACPSDNAEKFWMKYIEGKYLSPDAEIFVAEEEGRTTGFCVTEIAEDGAAPFGVICDVLVDGCFRGRGTGTRLLDEAVGWLRNRGISDIYLESGKDNAKAHEFFCRRGFVHVSDIFRLLP